MSFTQDFLEADFERSKDKAIAFGLVPNEWLKDPAFTTYVAQYQKYLAALGYPVGEVDGIHGIKTHEAVRGFQKMNGFEPDGVCGEKTMNALFGAYRILQMALLPPAPESHPEQPVPPRKINWQENT